MRVVSQIDAVATLPDLIADVRSHAVLIEQDGMGVALLVAPEEYEEVRQLRAEKLLASMRRLSEEISKNVKSDAEMDELMRALDRKAI